MTELQIRVAIDVSFSPKLLEIRNMIEGTVVFGCIGEAWNTSGQKGVVDETKKGTVTIASQLKQCDSCAGVIDQFKEMFPNIKIIFGSSGAKISMSLRKWDLIK